MSNNYLSIFLFLLRRHVRLFQPIMPNDQAPKQARYERIKYEVDNLKKEFANMSKSRTGKTVSAYTRAKMSKSRTGKTFSAETCAKISKSVS
jgi:hypothetical protein